MVLIVWHRLSVINAWLVSWCHSWSVYLLLVRPLMRWFLNICITLLMVLPGWFWSYITRHCIFWISIRPWAGVSLDYLLCSGTERPLLSISSMIPMSVSTIVLPIVSPSFKLLNHHSINAIVVITISDNIMHWYPSTDMIGSAVISYACMISSSFLLCNTATHKKVFTMLMLSAGLLALCGCLCLLNFILSSLSFLVFLIFP